MGKSKAVAKNILNTQIIVALAILVMSGFGLANPAHAQQTDADFSAYCRASFNNSAYQKFAQTWGTEHACVQGGTRQGIDLGEACYLTTGSRSYEISGARVLCEGNAGDAPAANANDTGEPDFGRYCNENFANSAYEKRPEPTGVKHYCRRPGATGGFTLQPIDLAVACQITQGVSQYRIAGARVFCTAGSGGGGGGNPPNDDGGGGGGGPLPDPNAGPKNPTPDNPTASDPANPDESAACQALGGEWRSGTLTMVDEIIENMNRELAKPCLMEMCPQIIGRYPFTAYMETLMIYQCHAMFFKVPEGKSNDDINLAIKEACEIEPILNQLHEQFTATGNNTLPIAHYYIFSQSEMSELCDCEPEDIPDFTARVEELQQQAEQELIAEFSE